MKKNLTFHSKTKHIELWHRYIHDLVVKEEIVLKYYNTNK